MASGGNTNTDFMSDETFDQVCRVCKRKGKNIEAKKYCVECHDYFCLTCVQVHQDIPALSEHKIVDKSPFLSTTSKKLPEEPQGSNQSQPAAPTMEKCDKHNHYYIDMYCQNHDDVGCTTCMAVDHRSCKDIVYIPEFIQNNASLSTQRDFKSKLESVAKSLKQHHDHLQRKKQRLLKNKAGLLEKVRKFRKEINERLDKIEHNSIADIEDKYKALIEKIEEGIKMLDANEANVKSAQDKVGAPSNNVSQEFINAKKGKNIASKASQCIEHKKAHILTEEIDFTPDQRIPELLGEINLLGKITQRKLEATGSTVASNIQLPTKGNLTTSDSGTTQQTVTSNVQLLAKRNQTTSGSGTTQQTATSNVQLQTKGNQTASGSGTTQQTATSNVQLLAKRNKTTSGSGTTQQTATSNVQLQTKGNQTASGSGTTQQTATSNVQLQTKGNQTASGSGTAQQTDALLHAKGSRKYNVKVKSDKSDCYIVSACTLEDGTIILSDCNNMKLKRLDSSTFTVTDCCDLPVKPWQVCPISKQKVAVCLSSKKVVQFISVGVSLKNTKQINTDFECYGMAYCNGNLYISEFSRSVYIYSVSGSKLRQLSIDRPGQSMFSWIGPFKSLFSDIRSVAVSKDGSKIYVCDNITGLTVLDNNGQVVEQYKSPQLQNAYDCYLKATGNLLVCGCNSDNVLQFGQNGDLRNEVVKFTEKTAKHCSICCNPQMSKMIIGRNENEIEVYDLVK